MGTWGEKHTYKWSYFTVFGPTVLWESKMFGNLEMPIWYNMENNKAETPWERIIGWQGQQWIKVKPGGM